MTSPSQRALVLASADGRDAFWQARPIWINPHVGTDARGWSRAWRLAEAEYLTRSGARQRVWPARYDVEALRPFRPADVPELPRRRSKYSYAGRSKRTTFDPTIRKRGKWQGHQGHNDVFVNEFTACVKRDRTRAFRV